jgi:hypothetical protein
MPWYVSLSKHEVPFTAIYYYYMLPQLAYLMHAALAVRTCEAFMLVRIANFNKKNTY